MANINKRLTPCIGDLVKSVEASKKPNGPSFIQRAQVNSEYVIVPNQLAQDVKMSLAAKGLLLCLLSLPEGWRIYKKEIHTRCCSNGRDAAVKAFNELIRLCYVRPVKRPGNLVQRFDYFVYPYRFNDKVKLQKPGFKQTGR